uniref:Uncharacterized protein n=1 Tax=Magallana gigas TaxID=29159 RepID=A0A8W8LK06_MAGGI
MGGTRIEKIIILSVLVSLITSSPSETTSSAMSPLDNKAATNDIDISTTRTTKYQEITAMHEAGETSTNTPLTRRDGSTFHSTVVSGATKTIPNIDITKENNTSSQILISMTAHDQAMSDSTPITNEEDKESASGEMSSLKSPDQPMFKESFTEQPTDTSALETPNHYLNEINHLNSNVSDLEEEVSSLTAAVVVLSLFLVTILILCAVYYIRRRLRPAKSPFDDINMKEIDVEKRENERRGPFFGNTDNIFRVSTATLGENDHTPVPAKTFKPAGNTGYSERTSASITIDGNIEDRSVL